MKIYNVYGTELYSDESPTMRETVEAAVKAMVSLNGANMSGANMSGANMSGANMSFANMSGADMSGADMSFADMGGANMGKTRIIRMDFGSWSVCIYHDRTQIGCQLHKNDEWLSWTPDSQQIAEMHGNAPAFWNEHGDMIKAGIRWAMQQEITP